MACGCKEEEEQKMVKLLTGLNKDTANHVELQSYSSFDELCQLAINVERQVNERKKKGPRTPRIESLTKPLEDFESPWKKGETSTNRSRAMAPNQAATMKERICFNCKGSGQIASNCPSRTLVTLQ